MFHLVDTVIFRIELKLGLDAKNIPPTALKETMTAKRFGAVLEDDMEG